jgi:hypothetical protein
MQSLAQIRIGSQARPFRPEMVIALIDFGIDRRGRRMRTRHRDVPNCVWREGLASWKRAERQKKGVRGKFQGASDREVFAGGRT